MEPKVINRFRSGVLHWFQRCISLTRSKVGGGCKVEAIIEGPTAASVDSFTAPEMQGMAGLGAGLRGLRGGGGK